MKNGKCREKRQNEKKAKDNELNRRYANIRNDQYNHIQLHGQYS